MTRGHDGYDFLSAESLAKQRAREESVSLPVRPPVADNDQAREELIGDLASADQGWHFMDETKPDDRDHIAAVADVLITLGWRKTEGA